MGKEKEIVAKLDLDELERIGKAATAGPWSDKLGLCSVGCCDDMHELTAPCGQDGLHQLPIGTLNGGNAVWLKEGEADANAAFVLAARNNWQDMIDELRTLRELVPKCISCGSVHDLEFGPDPYASEINHDDTDVWECKGCRRNSAMDI